MKELSHIDHQGRTRMVDVAEKPITHRRAVASGAIQMLPDTLVKIRELGFAKGNVLEVARIAGIMATKKTADLIPLCHPLSLSGVTVDFEFSDERTLRVVAEVNLDAKTGAEMEAMTAVSVTALTIYDMCKAIDRQMVIQDIRLEAKSGGKSGDFVRNPASNG